VRDTQSSSEDLSLTQTDYLGDLVGGRRAVFYEEMAQWSYRYIDPQVNAFPGGDTDSECRYHLNSLTLLSMYFDIIFIQTACLFNVTDLFLKTIIQKTLSHSRFRAMLKTGTIRICGWGGKTPREMFGSAISYASVAANHRTPDGYVSDLAKVFRPSHTVFRSAGKPDNEVVDEFRRRLRETEAIRHRDDLDRVDRGIDRSLRIMGQLTTIGFLPGLDLAALRVDTRRSVLNAFVSSWSTHLNLSIPGVHIYLSGLGPQALRQTITIHGKTVRSFLYAPALFAVFLRQYFSLSEYNRILGRPYEDLERLRNGDWKRFCDAYHAAVEDVSASVANIDLDALPAFDMTSETAWGKRIWEESNSQVAELDVNAFLEGLASISGVLLGMPLLGPAFKAAGALMKRRLNGIPQKLYHEHKSAVSPYIKKVRMSLDLQMNEI
jgi:hypothetical protein